jgi:membrane fusion protein YbhG
MKRKIILLILILLIGAVGVWAYRNRNREIPMVFSGSIEARDVEVGSLVGGRIVTVPVEEGSEVKTGDPIVTLETDLLDLQISEQKAQIAEAKATLARVRKGPRTEELARAKADYENAEAERRRLESLLHDGVIPSQQYDNAATKSATLLQTYTELKRGNRAEDIDQAEASLAREEARLAYLQRQRKETVVVAPVDGRIESIDLRPGDLVAANQPVARILEPNQMWVRVYVPEPKLGLIHVGQEVKVSVDTFPGRFFKGKIVEIRHQGEYTPRNIQTLDQRMELVFGVKVNVEPAPELKPGMTAVVQL